MTHQRVLACPTNRATCALGCLILLVASCGAWLPQQATVRRVVDGDTIELSDGRLVRYIGVDSPEVRRRVGGQWIVAPEPMGREATVFNRGLVEGRTVRLEYDVQTHDRFGRLLAYVYVHSTDGRSATEQMVNAELLRAGMAQPLTIPPNVKYVERFRALAQEAREAHRGLWGVAPQRPQGEGSELSAGGWRVARRREGRERFEQLAMLGRLAQVGQVRVALEVVKVPVAERDRLAQCVGGFVQTVEEGVAAGEIVPG